MIARRLRFLFGSTKGLVLAAIAMISLVTAFWGTLSGPMAEWGVRDVVVRVTGMDLDPAEREGRIIMLYHCIAMAVVAIEVYLITGALAMRAYWRTVINATVTVGYMSAMIFGLIFGYFGHNWIFHGLFIFGQCLMFFSGVLLCVALWPWREEFRIQDPDYAHTRGGVDLERVAFFTMAAATLASALFGAIPGAYFGNGFETFLAENVVRDPHKPVLQRAVIGHLHIMLSLIGVAITLLVGRWQDFKGTLHKIGMPLMIIGTIILSIGAWSVTVAEWAHVVIYIGSVPVLLCGLCFVIFSWDKLIRTGLRERGLTKGGAWQKVQALVRDPLRFGVGWQMVFMNFTVSFVGLFTAAKLEDIFRVWSHREERLLLTGHWHVLASLIATIILLYYADLAGLKGRVRKWFGWLIILGSDLAFAAVTVFEEKRLFVSEAAQQPVVDWTMILNEVGLGTVLVVLAALMIWRLVDLFRDQGRWVEEHAQTGLDADAPMTSIPLYPSPSETPQEVEA